MGEVERRPRHPLTHQLFYDGNCQRHSLLVLAPPETAASDPINANKNVYTLMHGVLVIHMQHLKNVLHLVFGIRVHSLAHCFTTTIVVVTIIVIFAIVSSSSSSI